jgi:hypothetical protein
MRLLTFMAFSSMILIQLFSLWALFSSSPLFLRIARSLNFKISKNLNRPTKEGTRQSGIQKRVFLDTTKMSLPQELTSSEHASGRLDRRHRRKNVSPVFDGLLVPLAILVKGNALETETEGWATKKHLQLQPV